MNRVSAAVISRLTRISTRYLPFADAATPDLPLLRLLRLSLFQIAVGMATVLLIGTLNRVMIVELGVSASLVAVMVAMPFLFAPLRALVGYKSDTHRSALGWRRVPYIWMGTLLQFCGLAIMPFALILLAGDHDSPAIIGQIGAALAFLVVGAGLQVTQTAGLALATDLALPDSRPKVVALMYVMLLLGMILSGIIFGLLLADFSPLRLIQVIQGAAAATILLNVVALWKQEARRPSSKSAQISFPAFGEAWSEIARNNRLTRFLTAVGLGTAAFNMQDIILEPYGGEILKLSVGETTMLTAVLALGALIAFAIAARALAKGMDPYRLAACGAIAGLVAFSAVIFAAPFQSTGLFKSGTFLIGFGGGLFAIGTLTAAMELDSNGMNGLALGIWGAMQATAAGVSIGLGGVIRDTVALLGERGFLGRVFSDPAMSYSVVYHIEIALLFAMLVAIGPLVRSRNPAPVKQDKEFGLPQFPV
jgi:MFS transporter, BCD family, chlorophyll transporter